METITLLRGLLLSGALGCAAAFAQTATDTARVHVEYVSPDQFTDLVDRYGRGGKLRDARLGELREHLARRANELLPRGQALEVSITDIDMAGEVEPLRTRAQDLRIVKDVYPPRINLRFRLLDADGKPIRQGERALSDLNFMMRGIHYQNDPLRYEKALLDEWLERELRDNA